ncbi:MAG: Type 1 glutamine amidotransferase-like domain-containing protein [Candidatus Roizmanbacteria bacterium]|nr:Type 1 glutamine amidotransferase-like domain-containing protein [Candidatus Roizmanbacteria bacterium]
MKLLLTSGGLTNKSIISALKELTGSPFNTLNLAFIPTASNMESGDKWWLLDDLETVRKLKFKSMDLVDISALPEKIWKKRLKEADVLLFEGGNTFHLNYWVHHSGLDKILPGLLKTRVYVGISAGTIIMTPSLILSSSEKEPLREIGEEVIEKGLGLVDFLIEPHVNNSYFPENTFDNLEKQAEKLPYRVYALDDRSAVKVVDGNVEVISEGKWKKFN